MMTCVDKPLGLSVMPYCRRSSTGPQEYVAFLRKKAVCDPDDASVCLPEKQTLYFPEKEWYEEGIADCSTRQWTSLH